MSEDCNIRARKFPNGEIKEKYTIPLTSLRDCQLLYNGQGALWNAAVFKKGQGLFDLTSSNAPACATLIGV